MPPDTKRISKAMIDKIKAAHDSYGEVLNELEVSEDTWIKTNFKTIVKISAVSIAVFWSYVSVLNKIDSIGANIEKGDRYKWDLFMERRTLSYLKDHNTNMVVPYADDIFWETKTATK